MSIEFIETGGKFMNCHKCYYTFYSSYCEHPNKMQLKRGCDKINGFYVSINNNKLPVNTTSLIDNKAQQQVLYNVIEEFKNES